MSKHLTDADVAGVASYGDDNIFVDNLIFNDEENIDTLVKEFFDGGKPSIIVEEEIVIPPPCKKNQKKYKSSLFSKKDLDLDTDKILLLLIFITFMALILIQQSKYNTLTQLLRNSLSIDSIKIAKT